MDERTSVHLKVPSCLSDFSVHLTRKLPLFLLPLKDTSGESQIIWLVSGSFYKDDNTSYLRRFLGPY